MAETVKQNKTAFQPGSSMDVKSEGQARIRVATAQGKNREFSFYFFQTGKTQGILFWHREKFANTGKISGLSLLT